MSRFATFDVTPHRRAGCLCLCPGHNNRVDIGVVLGAVNAELGDAGIKIDSVVSQLLGKSGRAMIEALIAGERNPGVVAELAKGVLRRKIDDLQMACDGPFTAAHGLMCRLHLDACHLHRPDRRAGHAGRRATAPFEKIIARLVTIPGSGGGPPR